MHDTFLSIVLEWIPRPTEPVCVQRRLGGQGSPVYRSGAAAVCLFPRVPQVGYHQQGQPRGPGNDKQYVLITMWVSSNKYSAYCNPFCH